MAELTGQAAISALKSIVWQFCKLDKDYQDFVFRICEGDEGKMDAIRIWNDFVVAYSPQGKSTFFIVLDGMQEEDKNLLVSMMQCAHEQKSQLRIRVFVTAGTQKVPRNAVVNTFPQISLDPVPNLKELVSNIDDVKKIVKFKLADTSIFSQKNAWNQGVQQRVLDTLSRQVQNDFPRLSLVINEIGQCVNSRQIDRILERLDEPIEVNLGRQIRSLNSKLALDEIKEVNALISWLESYKTQFRNYETDTPYLLAEQYVDVKLGIPRLIPLSESIAQRYYLLFEVDARDHIKWRYEEIQQYLRKDFEDQQTLKEIHKRQGKQSSTTDLEELDLLELVIRNNLNTVFGTRGAELFDRYELGEYFMSQRVQHTEMICADEKSNRYSVLFVCLQVLCEDVGKRPVHELRYHARRMLHRYLQWDTKHKLTPEENQSIGRFLVKLLRNDTVIDRWSQDSNLGIVACFPSDTKKEDVIWEWFRKIRTSGGLAGLEDQEWFSKISKERNACKPSHWDYAIDRIVDGWYTQKRDTWNTITGFPREEGPVSYHPGAN